MKILIVDDSSMSRRILRRILESVGHKVVEASEGTAGLELFFLEKPDLVFLDLTMRDMYGLDVLANLREINPAICVIIASADIQDSTREMVTSAGANAFINKPLSPEKVLEVLETVGNENKAT
ncbi:MAG TPA: response regulator [Pyrinomonadaceae bacterium]|nr:response regulator [Pyrinomonadaceae bacterium]